MWVLPSEEEGWLLRARRGFALGVHVVWGRCKSQVYLSPYVGKPFNSKVIKSFVPELRSRKCFSCFGIPMFYVYMLWTFYVHFTYSCMAMLQFIDQEWCTTCKIEGVEKNGKKITWDSITKWNLYTEMY